MKKLLLVALTALTATAGAQSTANYPSKPITLIVAYGAGGGADTRARQIAQQISPLLGQPVIVDNKPGAGGNIGTELISRAAPDGYTIGMGNFAPMAVNRTLFANLRYDALTDLVPIVLIDRGPLVLMVPLKSSFKTVQEIVAAAKAKPGALTFASGGIGGTHHLSGEVFKQSAAIDLIHIPYKSGAAATTDLLGGNVDMMFEQMYAAKPSLEGGKLRPIAITSRKRSPQFPAIPTFAESGYPDVEVLNWQGLVAPKGTPRAIVDRLNAAVNKVLADAKVRESITAQSNEVVGGTPEEFAALIKSESAKWGAVVRAAQIKPE